MICCGLNVILVWYNDYPPPAGSGEPCVSLPMPVALITVEPGGTISGPTMFTLADLTSYVAILGVLGETGIDSVTTTLTINFLARPEPADLVCRVDILRQGRRQIVCEARIFGAEDEKLVAQASCIYAPPRLPSD